MRRRALVGSTRLSLLGPDSATPAAARRVAWDTRAARARRGARRTGLVPPCPREAGATGARRRSLPRVSPLSHEIGDRSDGQLLGVDGVDFVPRQGRRDLSTDPGPCEPGAEHRLVRCILIEIDEDPFATLLLPPLGRDQIGMPSFELSGQRHRAGANLEAVPPRLEPDVDVEAPVPRRLGVPDHTQLGEQGPHLACRHSNLVEGGAWLGIEVDAELIRMGWVVGPVRPQVQTEASEVDGPQDVGDVGDDQGFDVVPFGVETTVVWSQLGAPEGTRFWKKDFPPAPSGNRSAWLADRSS